MNEATRTLAEELELCRRSRNPYHRFNGVILQRKPYWEAQQEIGLALADPTVRRICVKSGHMTGKSYTAAGIALAWLALHEDSGVIVMGPALEQVKRAVWKEIRKARAGSPLLRHVGRMTRSPLNLEYGEGWLIVGCSGTEPERLQGFHPSGPVLVIVDEASGINDPQIHQALDSLKPWKRVDISNPIKDWGYFYDTCQKAEHDPTIRVITIPSTDSPDIHLEHSHRGLADASWLRTMRLDWGEDSETYAVRVLAQFPKGNADRLLNGKWLDRSVAERHAPLGRRKLAMDLGLGTGGDDAVHVARDDNGIIAWSASKFRDLEDSAELAAEFCISFGIAPDDVSFDAAGLGGGFDYFLRQKGIVGARPYLGTPIRSKLYVDRRDKCHFQMRNRLNPARDDGRRRPFAIPPDFMTRFRREVREITIGTDSRGRNYIRDADEVKKALGHSPDYSVTLAQSFAFD